MREIKFRAWCGIYFEYSEFNHRTGCLGCNFSVNTDDEKPIQQYTGLKDKNGVEVYEGDIVKWRCENELSFMSNDNDIRIDAVKFKDGHFWPVTSPTHTCYYSVENPEFEVIGNIYENPELLKD